MAGAAIGGPSPSRAALAETRATVSSGPVIDATPTATPTPTPIARPLPASVVAAQPVRTCSIAEAASDGRLGTFQGSVRNATTGEILYDHGGATYSRTASVMKVLTSAAALTDKADAAVLAGRPFYALQGVIVSTDETQYGRDWDLGDLVNISFHDVQLTALIRAVHVVMDENSNETVSGSLELILD